MLKYILLIILVFPINVWSQPTSNLYGFTLEKSGNFYNVHSPRFLTDFNSSGYNNQPNFINSEELLFSRSSGEGTDIYKLNLVTQRVQRITKTLEPEYSPTPVSDYSFSTVRVEQGDESFQRLWELNYQAEGKHKLLLPEIKNVGYHCWLNDSIVALFLVSTPDNSLAIANINSGKYSIFASGIGRCLQKNAKNNLIYIDKIDETFWYLKEYDHNLKRATILGETKTDSEDFVVLEDDSILSVSNGNLIHFQNNNWAPIQDLKIFNINNASRLASHSGRLVIVAD